MKCGNIWQAAAVRMMALREDVLKVSVMKKAHFCSEAQYEASYSSIQSVNLSPAFAQPLIPSTKMTLSMTESPWAWTWLLKRSAPLVPRPREDTGMSQQVDLCACLTIDTSLTAIPNDFLHSGGLANVIYRRERRRKSLCRQVDSTPNVASLVRFVHELGNYP